jgi:hypothetical protein
MGSERLEDLGAGGKIILNRSSGSGMGRHRLDCCGKWRALVNAVMNLRVP